MTYLVQEAWCRCCCFLYGAIDESETMAIWMFVAFLKSETGLANNVTSPEKEVVYGNNSYYIANIEEPSFSHVCFHLPKPNLSLEL